MAEILNVPEEYELVCMLPIGFPTDKPSAPKKKVFGERAWFNSFGSDTENDTDFLHGDDTEQYCREMENNKYGGISCYS